MPERLFIFIQMEFPWALGPPDGRYLIRDEAGAEPERVVVLGTLSPGSRRPGGGPPSARRPWLARLSPGRRRGIGSKASPDPAPVATARATIVDPVSVAVAQQAQAWLEELDGEREVRAATAVLNRVLQAHRIASADPYAHEVSPAQALVIRAGWGEGEQVAYGKWVHARELLWSQIERRSPGRRRTPRGRSAALRPQERLAVLLGAHEAALMCEELILRARLDLDHGRLAHAAVELDRAFAAALTELPAEERQDLAIRIAELQKLQEGVSDQARLALPAAGGEPDEEVVRHALERLEAALRARSAAGFNLQ
ncbi:MAG TPA: hypothetical protein VNY34_05790 [Solirubrobacteraceae bacterium]|jgi:hypothetical protein|nr:hypothetical protein [Solirubrobacteraceae bacterium]